MLVVHNKLEFTLGMRGGGVKYVKGVVGSVRIFLITL